MSRNKDHFRNDNKSQILSYANQTLNQNSIMNPCGLIADSMFNDIFNLYDLNRNKINITEKEIALEIDTEKIYRNSNNSKYLQWYDKENEHFIVWMNMELFPNFIKKWGYINQNLLKGEYSIEIINNWGKNKWDIIKSFILAEGNKFGTEKFFGYILIICFSLEILFILIIYITKYKKRKFNPKEMKWD